MNPKFRRIAVFVGAAALAGGAGIGVAAQGNADQPSSTPGLTRPAQGQGGPGGQQGGPGAQRLTALAEALGVSESRLHSAIEKIRPSREPGSAPGGRPDSSDMAAALANELGLSVDKVRSALEAAGPAGRGPGGAPPAGGAAPGGTGGVAPDGSSSGGSSSGTTSGSLS
jgi:hypothetical protein